MFNYHSAQSVQNIQQLPVLLATTRFSGEGLVQMCNPDLPNFHYHSVHVSPFLHIQQQRSKKCDLSYPMNSIFVQASQSEQST